MTNNKNKYGCEISLLVAGIIFFIIYFVFIKEDTSSGKPTKLQAYEIAQNFVEAKLTTMGVPEFPSNFSCKRTSNVYFIKSYVDLRNRFGEKVRIYWSAEIEYKGGDWAVVNNWLRNEIDIKQ